MVDYKGLNTKQKSTNNSSSGNGENVTLTFEDGSPAPMTTDSKGRNVADYSQMTPEHGAEWIRRTFGDNADKVVDGKIKKAEAALKDAEKIKIDYSADDADIRKEIAKELFLSLQNKKGKEYYDTVTEIARRVAEGKARIPSLLLSIFK